MPTRWAYYLDPDPGVVFRAAATLALVAGLGRTIGGAPALQQSDAALIPDQWALGFAGVSLVLAPQYMHAYQKRTTSRFETRISIADHLGRCWSGFSPLP